MLVQAIQQMDNDRSIAILTHINSLERAELSKRPLSSLKYSLIGSCTLFTRAVIEVGLDTETSFMLSDYYINLIDETVTAGEAEALEYCGIPETLSSESAGITKDKARYQGRWRDGEVPNELSVGLAKTGVDKCVYKVLKYYLNLVVSTL